MEKDQIMRVNSQDADDVTSSLFIYIIFILMDPAVYTSKVWYTGTKFPTAVIVYM